MSLLEKAREIQKSAAMARRRHKSEKEIAEEIELAIEYVAGNLTISAVTKATGASSTTTSYNMIAMSMRRAYVEGRISFHAAEPSDVKATFE